MHVSNKGMLMEMLNPSRSPLCFLHGQHWHDHIHSGTQLRVVLLLGINGEGMPVRMLDPSLSPLCFLHDGYWRSQLLN